MIFKIMSTIAKTLATNLKGCMSVDIEITNLTDAYCLTDPNGKCYRPPQPSVRPQKTEECSFCKTTISVMGTVGVLTYDLFKRQGGCTKEKVAIMFSVPYNYIKYENCLAIGIYADDKKCDEALYKEMYYDHEKSDSEKHGFVRKKAEDGGLNFKGSSLDIKATMSPVEQSVMKVEVWDKPRDD
ncbi:DELTA-thalatoxin-Avl1a [Liparis tanakae]|uniref:DELTA-thalatoxin-Avl1a n=1 Tax=Liparis tanakae TaxID=230148 RepID=A0A4Z2FLE4_9TELE|nr:DELTA-thalatoxin-Avl1a [Liparis tanakae]